MSKYVSISDFPYSWRFTDDNYCKFSEHELSRVLPLAQEYSVLLWENVINKNMDSFVKIRNKLNLLPFIDNCNWNCNEDETLLKLVSEFALKDNDKVTVFWGKNTAVETDWCLFLNHWSDFCYPSDDGIVLIDENQKPILHYSEDKMYNLLEFKKI